MSRCQSRLAGGPSEPLAQSSAKTRKIAWLAVVVTCTLVGRAQSQAVDFGSATGLVSPPSTALVNQVLALGAAANAAGLPMNVSTVGGLSIDGMPVWELGAAEGSQYDAVASFSQPQHIAINLSAITWGPVLDNDPWDLANLVKIAIHEAAHKDFAEFLIFNCGQNPPLWATIVQCHKQHSGNACNEAYAYSKTIGILCARLADIPPGPLRDALEGELFEQIRDCPGFQSACEAANAECGPPSMIMPNDHQPCGSCPACSICP